MYKLEQDELEVVHTLPPHENQVTGTEYAKGSKNADIITDVTNYPPPHLMMM